MEASKSGAVTVTTSRPVDGGQSGLTRSGSGLLTELDCSRTEAPQNGATARDEPGKATAAGAASAEPHTSDVVTVGRAQHHG